MLIGLSVVGAGVAVPAMLMQEQPNLDSSPVVANVESAPPIEMPLQIEMPAESSQYGDNDSVLAQYSARTDFGPSQPPRLSTSFVPSTTSSARPIKTAEFDNTAQINTQPSPAATPIAKAVQAEPAKSIDRSQVDVFYATDRAIIAPGSIGFWLPSVLPLLIVLMGTLLAIIGLVRSQTKWLWVVATLGCFSFFAAVSYGVFMRFEQAAKLNKVGGIFFSGDRNKTYGDDEMNYGKARITLPPQHIIGSVERPSLLRFEFAESADKHLMIRQVETLEQEEFLDSVNYSVTQSLAPSVLLFIHGYNVGFEDALRRTAQIHSDLQFDGVPMLYSWPSRGSLLGYNADEGSAQWSITHLENLILQLHQQTNIEKLHVIVHSMGNRVLLGAVERLTLRFPAAQPMLGQVVMAAPDVDAGEFGARYKSSIQQAASRVTLYTSESDKALQASMVIHGYQRLGLASADAQLFEGIDTIDASGIDTSLLGHSYYGSHSNLIRDIAALVELGEPPLKRRWLQAVDGVPDPGMWRFAKEFDFLAEPMVVPHTASNSQIILR